MTSRRPTTPDPDLRPSKTEEPTLRVRGPADLVAVVPYLLGFHPSRSLVLMGLDGHPRSRVVVTARMDLDDITAAPGTLPHALSGLARGRADALVAAVFDDDVWPDVGAVALCGVAELPWAGLADALVNDAAEAGLLVEEVLLVTQGRRWSLLCDLADCCPPEGHALESSAVPAECTYAGLVALPDRASLEAVLEPLPPPDRDLLLPALDRAEFEAVETIVRGDDAKAARKVTRALFAAARRSADRDAPPLTDAEVVRFATALQRIGVRDALWDAVDTRRLDGRELWRELARRLPEPFDAAPLFLFAWASYRNGNGALAGIAADRALASDPTYSPADVVLAALSHAIDPRTLPRIRPRRRSA